MIIGEGGYGKIWHPPRNDTLFPLQIRNNQKYIQRFTDENWNQIKMGEKARKIFDPKNMMTSPVLHVFPRGKGYFSEILPFREKKLDDDLLDTKQEGFFWQLLNSSVFILQGFIRLHKKKMIHRDVKKSNFVFDTYPNFRLYLIDWGTAVPFSMVYDPSYSHWWTTTLENMPPEYKMFAHALNLHEYQKDDIAHDYGRNKLLPILEYFNSHFVASLRKTDIQFKNYLKIPHFLERIAPKADIFAMGVVLAQIVYSLYPKNKIIPFSIKKLITHMTDPNPLSRWDAKKSYLELKKIVKHHPS